MHCSSCGIDSTVYILAPVHTHSSRPGHTQSDATLKTGVARSTVLLHCVCSVKYSTILPFGFHADRPLNQRDDGTSRTL